MVHVRVLSGSLLRSSRFTLAFYMAHLERNIQQKISGTFQSVEGADVFCRIRGYIATIRKNGKSVFQAMMKLAREEPFTLKEIRGRIVTKKFHKIFFMKYLRIDILRHTIFESPTILGIIVMSFFGEGLVVPIVLIT